MTKKDALGKNFAAHLMNWRAAKKIFSFRARFFSEFFYYLDYFKTRLVSAGAFDDLELVAVEERIDIASPVLRSR